MMFKNEPDMISSSSPQKAYHEQRRQNKDRSNTRSLSNHQNVSHLLCSAKTTISRVEEETQERPSPNLCDLDPQRQPQPAANNYKQLHCPKPRPGAADGPAHFDLVDWPPREHSSPFLGEQDKEEEKAANIDTPASNHHQLFICRKSLKLPS